VSKDLAGLITSCKNGVHEWVTHVRASRKPGCPKDVDFTYFDPGTQTTQNSDTTLSPVYTCGGPAADIRAR
jgi:hypothetical protein